MSTLVYRAKFRPVRFGWCVKSGDFPALQRALRFTHCLWGGRFNPVIVIDDPHARSLIDQYQVDVLLAPIENEDCTRFMAELPFLAPPFPTEGLFGHYGTEQACHYLDILHPAAKAFPHPEPETVPLHEELRIFHWPDSDPFDLVFTATLGRYPAAEEIGIDYVERLRLHAATRESELLHDNQMMGHMVNAITPSLLSCAFLQPDYSQENHGPSLYVGSAGSFLDLVQFWNLRALNIAAYFYDPAHHARYANVLPQLQQSVRLNPGRNVLEVWGDQVLDGPALAQIGERFRVHPPKWYPWSKRERRPPTFQPMHWLEERQLMSQVSELDQEPAAILQLGQLPGDPTHDRHQILMLALEPSFNFARDERYLYKLPFVPALNEFYFRKAASLTKGVRASKNGLTAFISLWDETLIMQGVDRVELSQSLFAAVGIDAILSEPGLICEQLVRQLDGLQGCRVFKIPGVRALIENYRVNQSFSRSAATRLIADVRDDRPHFGDHANLVLETRGRRPLKPDDVFAYLLKHEVFRVGLDLECPSCRLEFWRSLDDVASRMRCEYCGKDFNPTMQLKDRDWAYRPSGLFGREDHQEGGVPVALTLQQLQTASHGQWITWLPALLLSPRSAKIELCETDFLILTQSREGRVQILIGECKARKPITEKDVQNLTRIARAFPPERFDVYIVFSKTGDFSEAELGLCNPDNAGYLRIILLTGRELEPYGVYERTAKEFAIDAHVMSLDDMVTATRDIFFAPKPKVPPPGL